MRANAGQVHSGQCRVHPRLAETVQRHLKNSWAQPLHRPSLEAYRLLLHNSKLDPDMPFILDSGCGTGESTQVLARLNPDCMVLGVDQSQARLKKSGLYGLLSGNGNCILLRAELATLWRLLAGDGLRPVKHYLLYPNPWPKPGHLQRRWHGHPVFPQLLALGGSLEMRCNWESYALEFAEAASIVTGSRIAAEIFRPEKGMSPFEEKYRRRGQNLYRVVVDDYFLAGPLSVDAGV